jgi:hypothetical protein
VVPPDEGLYLNVVELNLHREPASDSMLGFGPLPGPKPERADWGYLIQLIDGRCSGGLVGGWDLNWGVNATARQDAGTIYFNRDTTLIVPLAYTYFYLPLLNGMNIYGGLLGSGIGHEIHPNQRPTPNVFATHSYSFMDEPDQVVGVQVTGNVYRGAKRLLGYEVGVNNGIETVSSPNGRRNYVGALHYKTANLKTQVDYSTFLGDAEIDPKKDAADFPGTSWHGVISPRAQFYQYHTVSLTQNLGGNWSGWSELVVARQAGDGKSDTIQRTTSTGGFRGAEWGGLTIGATYKVRPSLWYSVRAEHFRDGSGYAMPAGAPSGYNNVTTGVHFDVNKFVQLRPEVRYDWQNAYRTRAYNSNSNSSQFTGTVDMILYF